LSKRPLFARYGRRHRKDSFGPLLITPFSRRYLWRHSGLETPKLIISYKHASDKLGKSLLSVFLKVYLLLSSMMPCYRLYILPMLPVIIALAQFSKAAETQTVIITLADIFTLRCRQRNQSTLAINNIAAFALK